MTTLTWISFVLAAVVFAVVLGLFVVGAVRASRRAGPPQLVSVARGRAFVLVGGVAIPAVILLGLMALTVQTGRALSQPPSTPAFVIEIVGRQFWWEVRYPEQGIVTANEIHVPVDTPVTLRMTSNDVIHSFWVPQLAGKLDLVPGQVTELWIEADEPGRYRGQCAEFCGIQHANMAFFVVADEPAAFEDWVARLQAPSAAPPGLAEAGRAVFFAQECAACHAIGGTAADGVAGPDLTHLMSREWIAAGTVRATAEGLRRFVTAAQEVKPGSSMPSFERLDGAELDALVAYLLSLE